MWRRFLDSGGRLLSCSSDKTPGEMCIAGEASGMPMAFEGTMKIYNEKGVCKQHVQGSGHLGPSYVGVASVREGRGILNTHMQPQMIRQI